MNSQSSCGLNTLSNILKTQDKLIIQQQNGDVFYINENLEQQKISQFRTELIKVLKQLILNQNDMYFDMIQKTLILGIESDNITNYEELKLIKNDEYLEEYITLIINLQNKEEEFITEIKNPYKNQVVNNIQLYANKMMIQKNDTYICEQKEPFINTSNIKNCIQKLTQYGFNSIIVDKIDIQIDQVIYCQKHKCNSCDDIEFSPDLDINLSGINCKCLEINCKRPKYWSNKYLLSIKVSIENTLEKLNIFFNDYINFECDNLDLEIIYLNDQCHVQKLEFYIQDDDFYCFGNDEDNNFELEQLFCQKRISEYKLNIVIQNQKRNNIQGSCFFQIQNQEEEEEEEQEEEEEEEQEEEEDNFCGLGILEYLIQIDKKCKKIIYFNIQEENNKYLKRFIKIRNHINFLKYQLVAFKKLISPDLHFNPTQTFFDLYEDSLNFLMIKEIIKKRRSSSISEDQKSRRDKEQLEQ